MRCGSAPIVTWAGEQMVDELARAAKMDPVAFRRQNVVQDATGPNTQRSLLAVLHAATKAANWQPKVAASNLSDANVVSGRSVAWSDVYTVSGQTKTAAVADVEVNTKTGKITVKHVYQAFSAGLSISPGLVQNQMVGGDHANHQPVARRTSAVQQDERDEHRFRHVPALAVQGSPDDHCHCRPGSRPAPEWYR
jgi:CO/xanthine dehydrogenase Mo-binding subunit